MQFERRNRANQEQLDYCRDFAFCELLFFSANLHTVKNQIKLHTPFSTFRLNEIKIEVIQLDF